MEVLIWILDAYMDFTFVSFPSSSASVPSMHKSCLGKEEYIIDLGHEHQQINKISWKPMGYLNSAIRHILWPFGLSVTNDYCAREGRNVSIIK